MRVLYALDGRGSWNKHGGNRWAGKHGETMDMLQAESEQTVDGNIAEASFPQAQVISLGT